METSDPLIDELQDKAKRCYRWFVPLALVSIPINLTWLGYGCFGLVWLAWIGGMLAASTFGCMVMSVYLEYVVKKYQSTGDDD
jgi:hypothetical protein